MDLLVQSWGGEHLSQVKVEPMFLFLEEPSRGLLAHQEHTPDVRKGDPLLVQDQPSIILVLIQLSVHELGPCFCRLVDWWLGHSIRALHPLDTASQLRATWELPGGILCSS